MEQDNTIFHFRNCYFLTAIYSAGLVMSRSQKVAFANREEINSVAKCDNL